MIVKRLKKEKSVHILEITYLETIKTKVSKRYCILPLYSPILQRGSGSCYDTGACFLHQQKQQQTTKIVAVSPFYHSLCQPDQSSVVNVLLCCAQPAARNLLTMFHETVVCGCLEHIYLFGDLCASCNANLHSDRNFFLTKIDNQKLVIIGQELSE